MAYTPNPYDPTQPVDSVFASTAAAEFRALKLIVAALGLADPFVGDWATLTGPLAAGKIASHTGSLWMALVALADVTLSEPTDVSTDWVDIRGLSLAEVLAVTVEKTSATGSAKMPAGTTAQRDGSPAVGYTRWNSTLRCNETWDGTEWVPDRPIVSAVISTASGTEADFPSIPAWVRELEMVLDDASLSGTDNLLVQLGTSGGVVTTGYAAASGHTSGGATAATDSAAGFVVFVGLAARTSKGKMTITRVGTTWAATHMVRVEANTMSYGAGDVTIADPVTTLRLTRTGTNTLDGGSFYVVMKPYASA